jgi:hypothetical protein
MMKNRALRFYRFILGRRVARMSSSDIRVSSSPAYRCAHAGYGIEACPQRSGSLVMVTLIAPAASAITRSVLES